MREMTFLEKLNDIRKQLKDLAEYADRTKSKQSACETIETEDRSEVMANLTLAYRHLEDASMRIGKTIQAYDGGVSVYDKDTTVGA